MKMLVSLVFFFLTFSAVGQQRPCRLGNNGCHGGDFIGQDIWNLTDSVVKLFNSSPYKDDLLKKGIDPKQLQNVYQQLLITSDEYVLIDVPNYGATDFACRNFHPEYAWLCSRKQWRTGGDLPGNSLLQKRLFLVIHELFTSAGIEIDQYLASSDLGEIVSRIEQEILKKSVYVEPIFFAVSKSFAAGSEIKCDSLSELGARIKKEAIDGAKKLCATRKINCTSNIISSVEFVIIPPGIPQCLAEVTIVPEQ